MALSDIIFQILKDTQLLGKLRDQGVDMNVPLKVLIKSTT